MKPVKLWRIFLVCVFFMLSLAGCSLTAGGIPRTQVWIDAPLNGLSFPPGQAVQIEGHVASTAGAARVEIWVNGVLVTTLQAAPVKGDLAYFTHTWSPPAPGDYTIQAQAAGADSTAALPDSIRLTVLGAATPVPVITLTPSPEISLTPTLTYTPTATAPPTATFTPEISITPTLVPRLVISYRAAPETIESGQCSNITWHVENAQRVVFGGLEQPFDGSFRACIDKTATYPLTVTLLTGIEEKYYVTIQVNAPVDGSPPPAPSPAVPADGLSITCKSSQSLVWLPVSDPSGIVKHQVEVQRSSDNASWANAPGSPVNVLDVKTTSIPVDCGWYYRWRVRAVDGAGNASSWSGWSRFAILLGK